MTALDIAAVLTKEANAIHGEKAIPSNLAGKDLYTKLNKQNSAALCLSGGGIRSAAFALGVVQALASNPRSAVKAETPEKSLLAKFHYLSTVSGGGYIGSCISTWVARAGFADVWKSLVTRDDPDEEAKEIRWLRSYSNYLTPKLGLMSPDVWVDFALYCRNLFLNWFLLIPALCVALLFLKLVALGVDWLGRFSYDFSSWIILWPAIPGLAFLLGALRFSTRHRPTRGPRPATQRAFVWLDLSPAILAGFFFVLTLAFPQTFFALHDLPLWSMTQMSLVPAGLLMGVTVYVVAWVAALFGTPMCRQTNGLSDFLAWIAAGAVYGSVISAGVYIHCQKYGLGFWVFRNSEILLLVFGVPLSLLAQLLAEMVFVGLSSYEKNSDSDREWLGRAAGWYLFAAVAWFLLMLLVFVGSDLLARLAGVAAVWLVPFGGVSGMATAILGKSSLSPAKGAATDANGISANLILAITAPVFAAVLVIGASALLDKGLMGTALLDVMGGRIAEQGLPNLVPGTTALAVGFLISLVLTFGAARYVNINRFSIHALYRNRIIRAFLGASNSNRNADPFTGFDPSDNPHMHELWGEKKSDGTRSGAGWRPFHIINIALNIVTSRNLAWQERKAESFSVSPLHSGNKQTGFRESKSYGDPDGISVGTAVAISGAAVSPNMGYHSSPAVAFLLTLFNVRLGWWLGNPERDDPKVYRSEGPPLAFVPLMCEMLGWTTDDRKYVYLSDGGHFENLALYEMVRRRCRFIVVSDAGCDPEFSFADLGDAVRKIYLDLGIKITFPNLPLLLRRPADGSNVGANHPYCTIGEIDYPTADGDGEKGIILYIKAGYHGTESVGITSYAVAHKAFPHEATSDQWFTESQFESYRALGFEITDSLLADALSKVKNKDEFTLQDVFEQLTK